MTIQAYKSMVSNHAALTRYVFWVAVFVPFIFGLPGCATTPKLGDSALHALAQEPSIPVRVYPPGPFKVTTRVTGGLSGIGLGFLVGGKEAENGRELIQKYSLSDPAIDTGKYFTAGLRSAYGWGNLESQPTPQVSGDLNQLQKSTGVRFAFDFQTSEWSGMSFSKQVTIIMRARLVDFQRSETIWKSDCYGRGSGSSKAMWQNEGELKEALSNAAKACAKRFLRTFVEPPRLEKALAAVEEGT